MRVLRGLGSFLLLVGAFSVAIAVGWEASWLLYGKYLHVLDLLIICPPLGLIPAGLFSLLIRQRERQRRNVAWALGATALAVFLLMVGLHYLRPATRFAFLGNHRMVFRAEPPFPGYVMTVYSFRADSAEVFAASQTELTRAGYEVDWPPGGRSLSFSKRTPDGLPILDGGIETGRVRGKRFEIDGDTIDVGNAEDWVTVQVLERDSLPLWLSWAVP